MPNHKIIRRPLNKIFRSKIHGSSKETSPEIHSFEEETSPTKPFHPHPRERICSFELTPLPESTSFLMLQSYARLFQCQMLASMGTQDIQRTFCEMNKMQVIMNTAASFVQWSPFRIVHRTHSSGGRGCWRECNKELLAVPAKIVNNIGKTNWGIYMLEIGGGADPVGESLPHGAI